MKKRLLLSFTTIALAASLVGGATFAIFTDTSSNTNNSFKAGTVDITAGEQQYDVAVDNIAPGDNIPGHFTVTNTGTLELRFDTSAVTEGALFAGNTPATISLNSPDQDVVVAPGDSVDVNYTVSLPLAANNDYQAVSGTVSFTVNAEQTANN